MKYQIKVRKHLKEKLIKEKKDRCLKIIIPSFIILFSGLAYIGAINFIITLFLSFLVAAIVIALIMILVSNLLKYISLSVKGHDRWFDFIDDKDIKK